MLPIILLLENTVPDSILNISRNIVYDGVLELALPYFIGEVDRAQFFRARDGGVVRNTDPSVLISTTPKACFSIHLPYLRQGRTKTKI
jgi:hypothetical protein